ncbi:MAG: hypothetical protein BWX95_01919 [Bacteroidetes bacterium ADurb.Bin141]|nr:MAG: hypothetical protein BWX95_01919 [Bacteroidetes bacterium ADurb.Bin141]
MSKYTSLLYLLKLRQELNFYLKYEMSDIRLFITTNLPMFNLNSSYHAYY